MIANDFLVRKPMSFAWCKQCLAKHWICTSVHQIYTLIQSFDFCLPLTFFRSLILLLFSLSLNSNVVWSCAAGDTFACTCACVCYVLSIFNQIFQINVCTSGANAYPKRFYACHTHFVQYFFHLTFNVVSNKRFGNTDLLDGQDIADWIYTLCPAVHWRLFGKQSVCQVLKWFYCFFLAVAHHKKSWKFFFSFAFDSFSVKSCSVN